MYKLQDDHQEIKQNKHVRQIYSAYIPDDHP